MSLNEEYKSLGYDIIGAVFAVHVEAGKGLRENYYQAALIYELMQKRHNVTSEVKIPALYKGVEVKDAYFADIIVDDKVIIEVKALPVLHETEARQLLTYLKLSKYKLGYLINFGASNFQTGNTKDIYPWLNGIYRFVNNI